MLVAPECSNKASKNGHHWGRCDIIEEATKKSKFFSRGFFIKKPNNKGLRLMVDYWNENKLIEIHDWPFLSANTLLKQGHLP